MAEFRKCFQSIDTENTGSITVDDLRAYMRKMNYKEKFVERWITLFDPKNEGVITYENYCRTLGLIPRRHDEKSNSEKSMPSESPSTSQPSSSTSGTDTESRPDQTEANQQAQTAVKSRTPTPPPTSEAQRKLPQDPESKQSRSEKSEDTFHPPSNVEEEIIPTTKAASFAPPLPPSKDPSQPLTSSTPPSIEKHEHQNQKASPIPKAKSEDHKSKKHKTRKPTNSQSEQIEEQGKPIPDVHDVGRTEPEKHIQEKELIKPTADVSEPMDLDEQQPTQAIDSAHEPQWIESKSKKSKGRKHKTSQPMEEAEHPEITAHEATVDQLPVEEILVKPEQSVHMDTMPQSVASQPTEPEQEGTTRKPQSIEHHKQKLSEPDVHHESPGVVLESHTTVELKSSEEPMEVEHQEVTYAVSPIVTSKVPAETTTTGDNMEGTVEKSKKVKSRKSKRSQSEAVEESIQPVTLDSSLRQSEIDVIHDETIGPVQESMEHEIHERGQLAKQKKARGKKTPRHSQSETNENPSTSAPPQVVEELLVEKQSFTLAAGKADHHVINEPEQQLSTTPLFSSQPISPSKEFVCVSDVHPEQPDASTHEVVHEMEVQHLGTTVHTTATVTEPVSVAEPLTTVIHTEEVDANKPDASKHVAHVKPVAKQAVSEKREPRGQGETTAIKTSPPKPNKQSKKQDERDKQDMTGKQPAKSQSQSIEKSMMMTNEKSKPKKAKQETKKGSPGNVTEAKSVQKKAEKRKHEEISKPKKKLVVTENSELEGQSKRSKDPAFERLTRLKRVGPISARRLKDKKIVREKKADATTKETKEDSEKAKKTKFPRSFIVQPGPDSYARKSKEVQRKHERLLKRKVERLEKVKRKSSKTFKPKYRWKVRPSLRTRGVVVILLAGRHRGKRVISLGRQRSTGLLLVTGPFRYNGCPLRRVHPNMVIATKTSVDLSKFVLPLRIHRKEYFARKRLNKRRRLDDSLLLKTNDEQEAYKPDEQRKADQLLVDEAVCKAIKAHEESRMLVKYLKSLFSIGKHDKPHRMNF